MAIADSDNNSFVKNILSILENATTFTSETSTSKLIEALLPREDRYKELGTGDTLQNLTNEFFNTNTEFPLLKFGKGMEDAESGDFQQDVKTHSNQKKILFTSMRY